MKISGKKKLACYEWEPTKSILTSAKSATYQKQQQQAAANEDPEDWIFVIVFVNIFT